VLLHRLTSGPQTLTRAVVGPSDHRRRRAGRRRAGRRSREPQGSRELSVEPRRATPQDDRHRAV